MVDPVNRTGKPDVVTHTDLVTMKWQHSRTGPAPLQHDHRRRRHRLGQGVVAFSGDGRGHFVRPHDTLRECGSSNPYNELAVGEGQEVGRYRPGISLAAAA
jgi:hypothetical protein